MTERGVVKEAILKVLEKKGCMEKEELVEAVAKELGLDPEEDKTKVRAIKAVLTKMLKRNKLKRQGNKVCAK